MKALPGWSLVHLWSLSLCCHLCPCFANTCSKCMSILCLYVTFKDSWEKASICVRPLWKWSRGAALRRLWLSYGCSVRFKVLSRQMSPSSAVTPLTLRGKVWKRNKSRKGVGQRERSGFGTLCPDSSCLSWAQTVVNDTCVDMAACYGVLWTIRTLLQWNTVKLIFPSKIRAKFHKLTAIDIIELLIHKIIAFSNLHEWEITYADTFIICLGLIRSDLARYLVGNIYVSKIFISHK